MSGAFVRTLTEPPHLVRHLPEPLHALASAWPRFITRLSERLCVHCPSLLSELAHRDSLRRRRTDFIRCAVDVECDFKRLDIAAPPQSSTQRLPTRLSTSSLSTSPSSPPTHSILDRHHEDPHPLLRNPPPLRTRHLRRPRPHRARQARHHLRTHQPRPLQGPQYHSRALEGSDCDECGADVLSCASEQPEELGGDVESACDDDEQSGCNDHDDE